jgi:hypothetical protein
MEQWSDPDPGSGIKHPGSATLPLRQAKQTEPMPPADLFDRKGKKKQTKAIEGCGITMRLLQ